MRAKCFLLPLGLVLLVAQTAPAADDIKAMKQLKAKDWTVPTLGMQTKLIPAGTFTMGSPKGEIEHREDEVQHTVTISKPFYIGVYEVKQKEYYDLMLPDYDHESWQHSRGPIHDGLAFFYRDRNHYTDFKGGKLQPTNPMECVTWAEAQEFCRELTKREKKAGRLPKDYLFRLPTEAEWEYACRAGTTGPYNVKGESDDAEYLKSEAFVNTFANVASGTTMPVGGKRLPNAWGLYDMHGNVYEWCHDWYAPYPSGPSTSSGEASSGQAPGGSVKDPTGPAEGKKRVARGACLNGPAYRAPGGVSMRDDGVITSIPFLRSASRYPFDPTIGFYGILGFRVVLAPAIPATTGEE
jgi:formylglycine-generating enzyme required for sulfatase activity